MTAKMIIFFQKISLVALLMKIGNVVGDTPVELLRCTSGKKQQWVMKPFQENFTTFQNKDNKCLDSDGKIVQFSDCQTPTGANHIWSIRGGTPPRPCTYYEDTSISDGVNIGGGRPLDKLACCAACEAIAACKSFTMASNQCWLHPSTDNHVPHDGWLSGTCDHQPAKPIQIVHNQTGKCIQLINSKDSGLMLSPCASDLDKAPLQAFFFDGHLKSASADTCVATGYTPAQPCDHADTAGALWCDPSKPLDQRINALISNLTLAEKAVLFTNGAGGINRIHWPGYNWWSEALHGVARAGLATSWPQVIGIGSTFNKTLFHALAELTGIEARGKSNGNGKTYWAPNINIFRDPRWGRGQETPGEDPTLNGEYAKGFVSGMQGDDPNYIRASSCLKHYAAYSQEAGRNSVGVIVNVQDMVDTYLPAFQSGVQDGKASGIMCSYNAETYGSGIYGNNTWNKGQHGAIPSCANKYLLNDLARGKWGFNGYVTSDCGAVSNVQNNHKYTNTSEETVLATLKAGMDIDCGSFMKSDTMIKVVQDKGVDESLLDTALHHLFSVQIRLGFLDPLEKVPYSSIDISQVNTKAHQQLAKDAADMSLVLLVNKNKVLPLNAKTLKNIALIGPNADATKTMQGNYYGTAPYLISPQMGIQNRTKAKVTFVKGCDNVKDGTCAGIPQAVQAAKEADAVVMVVGIDGSVENEGHDRGNILLSGKQDDLVTAISNVTKGNKPLILVIMSGGAIDISTHLDSVDAVMWCGYPGQSGGDAIADAIFGNTNRFGKLSQTWYYNNFTKQVKLDDYNMRPNKTAGTPGRGRFYTGPVVFKFGEGLSYTEFLHHVDASPRKIAFVTAQKQLAASLYTPHMAPILMTVNVTVRNIGHRDGEEVILLFGEPPRAGLDSRPLRNLLAFERVFIAKNDSYQHTFKLTAHHFSLVNYIGDRIMADGEWRLTVGTVDENATSTIIQIA